MKNLVILLICILITNICKSQTNLEYSTYIGGNDGDWGIHVVFDSNENLIIVGNTGSEDFPITENALPTNKGGIFIIKFDPRENKLLFSSLLGGGGTPDDIATDKQDNLYISGNTYDPNFPITRNAYQESMRGCGQISHCEHFITKIDMNSYSIVYSTFLGGSEGDLNLTITVDDQGSAIVAGSTYSSDYPITQGSFDETFNGGELDGIVAKLSPDGSQLLFSTYLGGSNGKERTEGINDVAVDNEGYIYVTGGSSSNDFPTTPNAYDKTYNGGTNTDRGGNAGDCFLTKIKPDGSEIVYSTYFGGSHSDRGNLLIVDDHQNVYLAGMTSSSDFPVTDEAFQKRNKGGRDVFVLKFNLDKNTLEASTLFGGSGLEANLEGGDIKIDSYGNIFISGFTNSYNLSVTDDAYDKKCSGDGWNKEIFIAKINPSLSAIEYLTYLGGSGNEIGGRLLNNQTGSIFVVGSTTSTDFPVTETAYDKTYNGGHRDPMVVKAGIGDVFITQLSNKKFK